MRQRAARGPARAQSTCTSWPRSRKRAHERAAHETAAAGDEPAHASSGSRLRTSVGSARGFGGRARVSRHYNRGDGRAPGALAAAASPCSRSAPACSSKCKDKDGDGRGENCEAGAGLRRRRSEARRFVRCVGARVRQGPVHAVCPCTGRRAPRVLRRRPSTAGVGMCRSGQQNCDTRRVERVHRRGAARRSNAATATTTTATESPTKACSARAAVATRSAAAACGGRRRAVRSQGELAVTSQGELTLRLHESDARSVWVPNTGDGTLSKVDAESAVELARYRVGGDTPERIAVDYNGDAWVLSPSLDGTSWLDQGRGRRRIAVVDRDGDGAATSRGPRRRACRWATTSACCSDAGRRRG